MTIQASCPKGHTLTLEEKLAGKKIRCPRCQTVFEVPDPDDEWDDDDEDEAISEKPLRKAARRRDDDDDDDDYDDDDDDRPRKKARRPAPVVEDDDDDEEPMDDETRKKLERKLKKKQLKLVDVGLLLHYIKLCIYVIGILLGMVVVVLTMVASVGGPDVPAFFVAALALLWLFVIILNVIFSQVAPLLGIVGSFLCCWIPKKSEAKGTIIMSLTFDLISMVAGVLRFLAVFNVFGMEENKTNNLIFLCGLINFICSISAWLTFLTYLRSVGKYIGEPALGNEALNLIARLVVQVISLILDIMIIIVFGRFFVGIVLAIILAIIFLTIWLIIFIFAFYLRQMKLISAMRRAIQNKL